MVSRAARFAIGLVVLLATPLGATLARADSPRLADARRAVEAVDYEEARRLLVEALQDGDNSPAAVAEIYRLSARAAVVLGQRDLAEQYYRRWLAIDPGAALPADAAPKLREPFVAAEAYIAAHGRLLARVQRTAAGELDVELIADPLAMAHAAAIVPGGSAGPGGPGQSGEPAGPGARLVPVPFGADHHARLTRSAASAAAAILDDHGNRLLELSGSDPAAEPAALAPLSGPATLEPRPWTRHWLTWAIPTGVFAAVTAGFGIAAIASYGRAHMIADDSGRYYFDEAESNAGRGRTFAWITAGAGALTIGFGIPAAILFFRQHHLGPTLLSTGAAGSPGVAITGRF